MAVRKKGGDKEKLHCSFCGKEQDSVRRLVAGPGVYICDECIELCNEIIAEEVVEPIENVLTGELPPPAAIKEKLDQYVIGQDEAKRALAVAVYNHYKRINVNQAKSEDEIELDKSNILLIGPTGSGKTLLAQTLARMLKVPFAIVDATALTEAGYVGEDVENILLRLIQNADNDIKKAEVGIIYIDEIDKVSRKTDNPSITRDVSGEGVQQALLKIIEGTVANVPPQGGRKHPHQDFLTINTKNILFICGGAFVTLDNIVEKRLGRREIGFRGVDTESKKSKKEIKESLLAQTIPDDLMQYGLIPEFIGRLPIIANLNDLDVEALRQIFTEPKNALLKQYQRLFELENVKLKFTDDAITAIADLAIQREAGARGLRSIIEHTMMELMYMIPSRTDVEEIVITPGVINNSDQPVMVLKKDKKKSNNNKKEKLA